MEMEFICDLYPVKTHQSAQKIRVFGIRHHGPGSSLRLMNQLRDWTPDCMLIECPADAQPVLGMASDPAMSPPVAILLYNPEDFNQAVHLPFAGFSPEWLALQYALAHHIPVMAMDLPWGIHQQLNETNEKVEEADPFTVIAKTMGYTDTERWWEYFFEQEHAGVDLFPFIQELMAAFRETSAYGGDQENQLREAWMRQSIRKAIREGWTRIAVVCGAFHAPALATWDQSAEADTSLLAPWSPLPVQATWSPWTFGHLSQQSGYGAGMLSPAWYELIYEQKNGATLHWMVRCARYLREKGVPVPPASLPHALEMAESLAAMRDMHHPGMQELEDAAIAVFVQGDPQWLIPIRDDLLIGDRMGHVPSSVPQTPLQKDFNQEVRSARLSRALATPGKIALDLDLRKPANLRASTLLHRLGLLEIPWGYLLRQGELSRGSFKERWRLDWKPRYLLRVLECGAWGLTVEEAASRYALRKPDHSEQVSDLAHRLRNCIHARLPDAATGISLRLRDTAAVSSDIWDLSSSLAPLLQVMRYGESFTSISLEVRELLDHLFPRILIGLPKGLKTQSQEEIKQSPVHLRQLLTDISLMGEAQWKQLFWQQLLPLTDDAQLAPETHAFICRLAWEEDEITIDELLRFIRDRLFQNHAPAATAAWVTGLLSGSETILLRQKALWLALDTWLTELSAQSFREILPALRKAFSTFSNQAKRQIGLHIQKSFQEEERKELQVISAPNIALSEKQQEHLLPALQAMLWGNLLDVSES